MKNELEIAILEEREAERKLAAARRRVNELIGIVSESQQRKPARKAMKSDDFAKACGQ